LACFATSLKFIGLNAIFVTVTTAEGFVSCLGTESASAKDIGAAGSESYTATLGAELVSVTGDFVATPVPLSSVSID